MPFLPNATESRLDDIPCSVIDGVLLSNLFLPLLNGHGHLPDDALGRVGCTSRGTSHYPVMMV